MSELKRNATFDQDSMQQHAINDSESNMNRSIKQNKFLSRRGTKMNLNNQEEQLLISLRNEFNSTQDMMNAL